MQTIKKDPGNINFPQKISARLGGAHQNIIWWWPTLSTYISLYIGLCSTDWVGREAGDKNKDKTDLQIHKAHSLYYRLKGRRIQ